MDIYNDLLYHLLLYFDWKLNCGLNSGKLMWRIKWRGKVKLLIEFLSMCVGVMMMKVLCIHLCLSSSEPYLLGGTSFSVPWSRCLIWWRGVCRSMGCKGQLVYLGCGCFHMWFWYRGSVPWRYLLALILCDWFYCGGAIGREWVSRFFYELSGPSESRFFASRVS